MTLTTTSLLNGALGNAEPRLGKDRHHSPFPRWSISGHVTFEHLFGERPQRVNGPLGAIRSTPPSRRRAGSPIRTSA